MLAGVTALVVLAATAVVAWLVLVDPNLATAPAAISREAGAADPSVEVSHEAARVPPINSTLASEQAQGATDPASALFIEQAEAICTQATQAQRSLPTPNTAAEIATYTRKTIAISDAMTSRLRSLDPPPADRKTIDTMLGEIDHATVFLRQLALAAEQGDGEAVAAAGLEARARLEEANAIALRYGLDECAAQGG